MIVPYLFADPSTLNTGLGTVSFCVPSRSLITVLWSMKLSVAPVSRRPVSSAMPRKWCNWNFIWIEFLLVTSTLLRRKALTKAVSLDPGQNPSA